MDQPAIPIKSLLRLAGLSPVEWITPLHEAREIVIRWVSVSLDSAQPGDALLIPAEKVSRTVLKKAKSGGIVALLLCDGVDDLPEFLSTDIPMVRLPLDADLEITQRLLLTTLIGQRAHLSEWGSSIHSQLDRIVAEGGGLPGLARAMTGISGRGVMIQDKRLRVVASNPSPELDAVWDELLSDLSDWARLPEEIRDRKEAGKVAFFISQSLPGNLSRLVTPISVGSVARGYLSLVGLEGDLDAMDRVVAEQGALACAVQMSRSKAVREAEKRLHGDLLTALLQGDLSPRDARLWGEAMGLDLAQDHTALRFAWDGESLLSLRRLETLVSGEIARLSLTVIVETMESEVICFCQVDPRPGEAKLAIDMGHSVLEKAREENQKSPARCGIGSPASDLAAWHTSFRQAGQALELARRLHAEKPLYFPDLSVYRLLLQLEGSEELRGFEDEILEPLMAYETGEELVRTLEAYFEHNGNLSQTADALFIHRNSLIYRMERIAGITGLDLDNPETRLAVQLALHIHRMSS
jgi:PucR family transcriptional regulator, purine catabolism regulatory protein